MLNLRDRLVNLKSPIIIGIAGDSGSGKTTYSNGIRKLLGIDMVETITLDGYHREDRQARKVSGSLPLDPAANKLDLFYEHLKLLKSGKSIELPIYNHETGRFDPPKTFSPSPVIIIEGLHALYPEFMEFYDFTIYADPAREVKWQWKKKRDLNLRHHKNQELVEEMHLRESAYKRWIDFQKTSANVVIKIYPSTIAGFAKYELLHELAPFCYKVELIIEPTREKLPALSMLFDLSSILTAEEPPFLLSAVPSMYWGKKTVVVHLDGVLSQKPIEDLEEYIVKITGLPIDNMFKQIPRLSEHEQFTAVQFAQLLIGWRFLELVTAKLAPI